jgi:hypothetical protein
LFLFFFFNERDTLLMSWNGSGSLGQGSIGNRKSEMER